MDKIIEKTIRNLQKNNMAAYYAETKEEAAELVKSLLKKGDKVSVGGSMTLFECGILDILRSGDYEFLDRYAEGLSRDDIDEIYRQAMYCDGYLCSSNAVTEEGGLINVDGNCNRIAAIEFGPKSVIMIVGRNKIVPDTAAGFKRVKTVAAPLNARRLNCDTPCAKTGVCISPDTLPGAGCYSAQRICGSYVVCGRQRIKDRIKVIICNQDLGY